ncbi:unnamed protein product [Trichobilharzia regenti]|nr:unnamed protein product [Trichobilharzia regenti]
MILENLGKFGLSVQDAGIVNSLVYIVSAVASPVFGSAIDFIGYNVYWLFSGIIVTMLCHICFAFTTGQIPPIAIMIIMGFAYSILASSLWPMVAFILPLHQRGTAYGLIQSVQNLGLGVISIFAGYLVDTKVSSRVCVCLPPPSTIFSFFPQLLLFHITCRLDQFQLSENNHMFAK